MSDELRNRVAQEIMSWDEPNYVGMPGMTPSRRHYGHADAILALLYAPERVGQPFIRAGEPVRGAHVRPGDGKWCEYLHNGRICNKCGFSAPEPAETSTGEPAYTGEGTETLEGWVAPYSEGLWTFEEGEADPHPTSIRASLVLRGAPKFGGPWAEVRGGAPTAAEPEEVQKDDEGRPYPCGAFISNDSRWLCRLASDHDGDHEWVQPFAGKPAYTSTGDLITAAEPRGCPTPGACSCVAAEPEREAVAWMAEVDWGDGRGWIRSPVMHHSEEAAEAHWRNAIYGAAKVRGRTLVLYAALATPEAEGGES